MQNKTTNIVYGILFTFILLITYKVGLSISAAPSKQEPVKELQVDTKETEKASPKIPYEHEIQNYQKHVVITFDDGPSIHYTDTLLDTLRQKNVPATFFLLGQNIEGNESLVKRIDAEGHTIGNHSYSHVSLVDQDDAKISSEFRETDQLVYNVIKKHPKYVRTPYGANNENVLQIADRPNILWDVDSIDWDLKDADKIIEQIMNQTVDGSIILMHDIHPDTVEAIPKLIDKLHQEGFGIVPMDWLLGDSLSVKNYYRK